MGKKSATAAEKRHIEKVASLGCLIHGTPAEIHHIRTGQGMSQRAGHGLVIPLCWECHRGDFSIHMTPESFQAVYGSELELLNETIIRVSQL